MSGGARPAVAGNVRGRVLVLAGAGRRGQVGEAVARCAGERGARVILIERNAETARELTEQLKSEGIDAWFHTGDLTDPAATSAVAAEIQRHNPGGVHGLVHLAGGFAASGPVGDADLVAWQRQLDNNLTTALVTTRAFLPLLRQASGSIVYFSSATALPGAAVAGVSAYAVAKTGVATLMRAVASEEREHGVRANALAPSSIRTEANVSAMGASVRYVEREAVAEWVLFLVSDASAAASGQVIRLG
jgi:NAD(P)-dependent dehydrogenase (short-subunit alcohol dehydrogenase family)